MEFSKNELEISLAFQTDKSIHTYAKLGRLVESYGFDRISMYNDLFFQPAWYPLMLIAQATKKIKLGPAAVNPFTCHPINIAANIDLLNQVAPSRIYLGMARGAWLNLIGVQPYNPITALHDAFGLIRHLLTGQTNAFHSSAYPLEKNYSFNWTLNKAHVPFLLGSWGTDTINKCLPLINEVKIGGTANPAMISRIVQHIKTREQSLSHSSATGVVAGAVSVVHRDAEIAKQLARREVAPYLPVVAKLDPTLEISPEMLGNIQKAVDDQDYELASQHISDDLLHKFAFSGTPEDIITQCIALYEAGATRVELGTPHGLAIEDGINLLGNEVLPAIRDYINETTQKRS